MIGVWRLLEGSRDGGGRVKVTKTVHKTLPGGGGGLGNGGIVTKTVHKLWGGSRGGGGGCRGVIDSRGLVSRGHSIDLLPKL